MHMRLNNGNGTSGTCSSFLEHGTFCTPFANLLHRRVKQDKVVPQNWKSLRIRVLPVSSNLAAAMYGALVGVCGATATIDAMVAFHIHSTLPRSALTVQAHLVLVVGPLSGPYLAALSAC